MEKNESEDSEHDRYGVVIDAGSSGSRIYVYRWQDPGYLLEGNTDDNAAILRSVPQIYCNKGWTKKFSPGLSSFQDKPDKAFKGHIKSLLKFSETIIPKDKIKDTPVFIQSTAGMRLVPQHKRDKITEHLCRKIRHDTEFLFQNCEMQVQTIDGETEGLYGWLALNYLKGYFNSYDTSVELHDSYGFMDMGGASTQIAFKPNNEQELQAHSEDVSTIILKSVNGDVQTWQVFAGTWLNFGTNETRKRYLSQLVNLDDHISACDDCENSVSNELTDPCLPKNAKTTFTLDNVTFNVIGSGNYDQCSRYMYPLLAKNKPCKEDSCLFNGVHAPKIDFEKDRFLGVSEYWYTTNDIFKLGGEYNHVEFSMKVKEFCESDWSVLKENNQKGLYNNLDEDLLRDACFKANWVINVLHEGFGFPSLGIDSSKNDDQGANVPKHISFLSADEIDGTEISWTLGKILLYASGMVKVGTKKKVVGLMPGSYRKKQDVKYISGSLSTGSFDSSVQGFMHFSYHAMLLLLVCFVIYVAVVKLRLSQNLNFSGIRNSIHYLHNKFKKIKYNEIPFVDPLCELEEGILSSNRFNVEGDGFQFRSRSMLNQSSQKSEEEFSMQDRLASGVVSPALSDGTIRTAFSMADFSKFNRPSSKF